MVDPQDSPVSPTKPPQIFLVPPPQSKIMEVTDFSASPSTRKASSKPKRSLLLFPLILLLIGPIAGLYRSHQNQAPADVPDISIDEQLFDRDNLLMQADRLVQRNELKSALRLIANVPEASEKREEIIKELLLRAQNAYPKDLDLAVYILQNIPANSPQYAAAQALLKQWTFQLNQFKAAEFALEQGDLAQVKTELESLKGTLVEHTERYRAIASALRSGLPERNVVYSDWNQ